MSVTDLSKKIAQLSPAKRARLLARLRDQKVPDAARDTVNFKNNFAYRFTSDTPFDFAAKEISVLDPDPGCVQIRAVASSLNFRDVMIASKLYPASPGVPTNMGSDYAGIVEKVGPGVSGFRPGDEVIALHVGHVENQQVLDNCHFIRTFNVFAECVCKKPNDLSFVEAACIPTVFLTAYIGLVRLANLKPGEKVLIHTATGGVGLSAIRVASWLGAEIYATAGSDDKRQYLQDMGITQVFDSRSTDFSRAIQAQGGGLDVVLNTLSGELMTASMPLLRPFGRFIHIDKKDVNNNFLLPMGLFIGGISFQFLDISLLFENPALMNSSLQELVEHFEKGNLSPIEHTVFPADELKKALSTFSRATHLGKLVLQYEEKE